MKKASRGRAIILLGCAAMVLILANCAGIKIPAVRAPNMDTTGIQRIAIQPFSPTNGDSTYVGAARHATTTATQGIQGTGRFQLVNFQTVDMSKLEDYADAVFSGQITRIGEETVARQGTRKDANGNTVNYTYYMRTVQVDFEYSFTRARDKSMIGPISKSGTTFRTSEDRGNLPSIESLAYVVIDRQLKYINRDVAPYEVMLKRKLASDKNKAIKDVMKAAAQHVKSKSYMQARQAYLAIWEKNQSVPAAVNASIFMEAAGEIQAAADFMQQVYSTTSNPIAKGRLDALNRELAEIAGVSEYDDTRSMTQKATDHAIGEISKVIPAGAKLWIQNNAAENQNIVNDVIDGMISALLKKGVAIVEREALDLILKEQNFQMTGNVNDDDLVRISQMAGANIIVIVNTTGAGAGRRLQVRVLDIESATILLRSENTEDWHL